MSVAPKVVNHARIDFISKGYSKRKADYIFSTLSDEELFMIDGTRGLRRADYLALAKTNRILADPELTDYIDSHYCVKKEFQVDYNDRQVDWMQHEWDVLQWGLDERRENRKLTCKEFIADFNRHRNGQRFKIFYFLSNPHRVTEI